jgi:hypothetical protein
MNDDKDNIQLSTVEDHDGTVTIRGGGARSSADEWDNIIPYDAIGGAEHKALVGTPRCGAHSVMGIGVNVIRGVILRQDAKLHDQKAPAHSVLCP